MARAARLLVLLLAASLERGAAGGGLGLGSPASPSGALPFVPRLGKRLFGGRADARPEEASGLSTTAAELLDSLGEMLDTGMRSASKKVAMIALSHVAMMRRETIMSRHTPVV
jgi:hypothetical protein